MRRLATIALVGLLAVGGCGCGGSDDDTSPPTTRRPSPTTSSPPTTASVESQVEEAYLAYWEMGERLLENPNPEDPEIPQRTTGDLRGEMIDGLTTLRAQGQAVRYGDQYSHDVLSVAVTSQGAEVADCLIDDGVVIDLQTGEQVRGGVVTVLYTTTMVREGEHWKASEAVEQRTWEGVSQCDE